MTQAPEDNKQLNIEISEEVAEGMYANLAIITHSHAEFVIDFVNVMPGTPKSKVKSRIILTPQHAKRFMKALTENITRFEGVNGKIQDLEDVQIPMNFGGRMRRLEKVWGLEFGVWGLGFGVEEVGLIKLLS